MSDTSKLDAAVKAFEDNRAALDEAKAALDNAHNEAATASESLNTALDEYTTAYNVLLDSKQKVEAETAALVPPAGDPDAAATEAAKDAQG